MTSQFSPKVSEILAFSREEAVRLSSGSVMPEHILLGMMRINNGPVNSIFSRLNIKKEDVKSSLEMLVHENKGFNHPVNAQDLILNNQASNILKLAILEARLQHEVQVDQQHLLLAILHDRGENGAKQILERHDMTYDSVLSMFKAPNTNDALQLPEDDEEDTDIHTSQDATGTKTENSKEKSKTPVLDNFSTDLTRAALDGKLDPCVGREQEIQRVMEILGRRKKNNPILIGEPGVGKSAIVEGMAQMIALRKCSPMFFNKKIVSLDMTGIVAGTKYR